MSSEECQFVFLLLLSYITTHDDNPAGEAAALAEPALEDDNVDFGGVQ